MNEWILMNPTKKCLSRWILLLYAVWGMHSHLVLSFSRNEKTKDRIRASTVRYRYPTNTVLFITYFFWYRGSCFVATHWCEREDERGLCSHHDTKKCVSRTYLHTQQCVCVEKCVIVGYEFFTLSSGHTRKGEEWTGMDGYGHWSSCFLAVCHTMSHNVTQRKYC